MNVRMSTPVLIPRRITASQIFLPDNYNRAGQKSLLPAQDMYNGTSAGPTLKTWAV